MDEPIHWSEPFCDDWGNGMVYRPFAMGGRLYAVGFEQITTLQDFTRKGGSILKIPHDIHWPLHGVWAILFDEIDPEAIDFKGFSHIQLPGLLSGRVLHKVACIIFEHYPLARAGVYVFSAAADPQHLRQTDLAELYNRAMGLEGYRQSRLFRTLFKGWQASGNCASGGREYVVTTDCYKT